MITPVPVGVMGYNRDDRITVHAARGDHIALTCVNHPNMRWSTKNLGYIGARTIFYNLHGDSGMGDECSCAFKCLVVAPEVFEQPIID